MEKGWRGLHEINRVVYDPQRVTIRQMIDWLKESGTYKKTLVPSGGNKEAPP